MNSAQIQNAPSAAKSELIGRFLIASGIQSCIDSGSFLDHYALHSPTLVAAGGNLNATLDALRAAYQPHRIVWQEEYESHVNWEFSEVELQEILAFIETPSGQHFLEGRWRMDAYIGTNTEHLIEEIILTAAAVLAA